MSVPRTEFVPQSDFVDPPADPAETPPDIAAEVWSAYVDDGLRLLRLIAPASTLDQAAAMEGEATGGVQKNGMVQIAESQGYESWWAMRLLAHEYVHAQQDFDYGGIGGLFTRYSHSNVTAQGVQAFVEGEADMYAWLTHAFMRNVSSKPWELEEYFDLDEKGLRSRVANSDSPWTPARQWQHYAIGARYLHSVWQVGQNIAVRNVLHNLNPDFGAWASGFVPKQGPRVSRRPVCAPADRQLAVRDSLGPSGVFALLIAAASGQDVVPTEQAWELATELTEDQLQMYAPTLGEGVTQAQWLEETAKRAMCPLKSPPLASAGADAGFSDAGCLDAAANDAGAGRVAVSQPGGETDAGGRASLDGGAGPTVASKSADPRARLVPDGPVWVSWAFGFESQAAAKQFAELVAGARWVDVDVERQSDQVVVRATRQAEPAGLLAKWRETRCDP